MSRSKGIVVRITDVDFDTDGNRKLARKLKREWIGQVVEADSIHDVADIISDHSGWLINSFNYVKVIA